MTTFADTTAPQTRSAATPEQKLRGTALVADDEPLSREFLAEVLRGQGLEVVEAADGDEAIAALERDGFDFVLTDLKMPGRDGLEVVAAAKRRDPELPVILATAHGTVGVAVDAMRSGADDVLEKPVAVEDLELALIRTCKSRRLQRENRMLREQAVGGELCAFGPAMTGVVALVERIAPSQATALILGESGTGKERVAALLHRRSGRAEGPFIKVNCAAIPENLMESELFGHEAGAFTGAGKRRAGRFEVADGGTLFLDEVGEMSPALQAKVLRVLQEGEFERVGGTRPVSVDVRIVAATHRDLEAMVKAGTFREDLYYRLNVVPVQIPPLRERTDEIVPLARHFLADGLQLAPDAEPELLAHGWPGNVRELQNAIQRAGLFCEGGIVDASVVRRWLHGATVGEASREAAAGGEESAHAMVGRTLRDVESELIEATLAACDGNRTKAAGMLGISVRTLFNRLKTKG